MSLGDTQRDQQFLSSACQYEATRYDLNFDDDQTDFSYAMDFDFGVSDSDIFGVPSDMPPLPNDPLLADDPPLAEGPLLAGDPLLSEEPFLAENVPNPEFSFDDLIDLDLMTTTECTVGKHAILASHPTPPIKYHDIAKELDEGIHHLLHMIGVERRSMNRRKSEYIRNLCISILVVVEPCSGNDAEDHYLPLPWCNHMGRLVAQCKTLHKQAKILRKHDQGDYRLLCQTVDHVLSEFGSFPELTWSILMNGLDEDGQIVEGRRDYKYLQDMRTEIIRMRCHPVHKLAMIKGARVLGPKWVRKQGERRLFSK